MAVLLIALGGLFDGGGPDGPNPGGCPSPGTGYLVVLVGRHLPLDSAYSNCFWNKYHGPHTVRETTQLTLDHRLS